MHGFPGSLLATRRWPLRGYRLPFFPHRRREHAIQGRINRAPLQDILAKQGPQRGRQQALRQQPGSLGACR